MSFFRLFYDYILFFLSNNNPLYCHCLLTLLIPSTPSVSVHPHSNLEVEQACTMLTSVIVAEIESQKS